MEKPIFYCAEDERDWLRQQLAASQATNGKLREALGKFRDNVLFRIGSASPYRKVAQEYFEYIAPILAIPNDTTALREMIAGVYEECDQAVKSELLQDELTESDQAYNMCIEHCRNAIRALAEKAKA